HGGVDRRDPAARHEPVHRRRRRGAPTAVDSGDIFGGPHLCHVPVKVGMSAGSKKDVEMSSAPLMSVRPIGGRADVSLVMRCVEGDETAWRDLHRSYYPIAAAFLRKLGVQE